MGKRHPLSVELHMYVTAEARDQITLLAAKHLMSRQDWMRKVITEAAWREGVRLNLDAPGTKADAGG